MSSFHAQTKGHVDFCRMVPWFTQLEKPIQKEVVQVWSLLVIIASLTFHMQKGSPEPQICITQITGERVLLSCIPGGSPRRSTP